MSDQTKVEIRVAELLASRLCHELVGAAGAVSNGVEFLNELEVDETSDEAMALVGKSAGQLIARLKFFRLAYGYAGRVSEDIPELRSVAHAFVEAANQQLSWPLPPMVPELREGGGKLLLNMIILGCEALIRGGGLVVTVDDDCAKVTAQGDDAALASEIVTALNGDCPAGELNARSLQGYWTRLMAQQAGYQVKYSVQENEVSIFAEPVL